MAQETGCNVTPAPRLRRRLDRDEANLNPLVERGGYATEHRQRMSIIIRVFEPADHRSGRSDQRGKFFLRQVGPRPKVVDLSGQLGVDQFLLERLDPLALGPDIAVESIIEGFRCEAALSAHAYASGIKV
jgi:hypothetical protein